MKVCIVGTGYVGLPTGACFAEVGNQVACVDTDAQKIARLKQGEVPIFEPGLEALLKSNIEAGRMVFSTSVADLPFQPDLWVIAVGTPSTADGGACLDYVFRAASDIGNAIAKSAVVMVKSTVPVGTTEKVETIIHDVLRARNASVQAHVVFCPEFLKQGAAVSDTMHPDRVVIGANHPEALETIKKLYAPFVRNHDRTLCMSVRSAEMTKYAANAMLATKISFINEIANLCDTLGADVESVRVGIGSDSRIGYSFIYPGIGYGGSCFPKDVKALIAMAAEQGFEPDILKAVDARNLNQKAYIIRKIESRFGKNLDGKTFALWGLAFKPETDDMREAPSLIIVRELLARGAHIRAYDPIASQNAQQWLRDMGVVLDRVSFCPSQYDALAGSDAVILVTEWKPFRNPDFERMKATLRSPVIFDGRNQYDPAAVRELGFEYFGVGR